MNELWIFLGIAALIAIGLANLFATGALGRRVREVELRMADIDRRVIRLEAQQENAVTSDDMREFYERQAHVEGQLRTVTDLLRAIQKHLLENDP